MAFQTTAALEALVFPEQTPGTQNDPERPRQMACVLCDDQFAYPTEKDALFTHLVAKHKLVVGEIDQIHDVPEYVAYWKRRLTEAPLETFLTVIKTNTQQDARPGTQEEYYFLCDALPEDRRLRERLQRERLAYMLAVQEAERRETNFDRECLFCAERCGPSRNDLFAHMYEAHSFNLGSPDNVVGVARFLDTIQEKLDRNVCLYCEKVFRDRTTLKDHMRKKQHRKLNPKNREYDQFYLINYLELGKNWEALRGEEDGEDDSEWDDWVEDSRSSFICLLCHTAHLSADSVFEHMKAEHGFDFLASVRGLDFYARVKVVNFIRRRVHERCCFHCEKEFRTSRELLEHMESEKGHLQLPEDKVTWDQPEYYFPTYENDMLLSALEQQDSGDEKEEEGEKE